MIIHYRKPGDFSDRTGYAAIVDQILVKSRWPFYVFGTGPDQLDIGVDAHRIELATTLALHGSPVSPLAKDCSEILIGIACAPLASSQCDIIALATLAIVRLSIGRTKLLRVTLAIRF